MCELLRPVGAVRATADTGLFVLVRDGAVTLAVSVHENNFLYGGTGEGVTLFESELQSAFLLASQLVFTGLAISFSARRWRGQPVPGITSSLTSTEWMTFPPLRTAWPL